MLKTRVIPCLDVKDGRVVKGINFVDLIDAGDPVAQASVYEEAGADELCFLDITASSDNRGIIFDVVQRTAEHCFMPLTVGGGVRTVEDIRRLLMAGADKVSINTAAVTNPDFVREAANQFGNQCIVVAIDAKRSGSGFKVFTHGGRRETEHDAVAWAEQMASYGAGEILLTSMDRDGTKNGFDVELTRAVADAVSVPVIASGGAGKLDHLVDAVVKGHASAVLAASIFHFGTFTIEQAKRHMEQAGIAVRATQTSRRVAATPTVLTRLFSTIEERRGADPNSSYVSSLLNGPKERTARKVGEEAMEAMLEALKEVDHNLVSESADLLFHLMVLWAQCGVRAEDVWSELAQREGVSGLVEKANRKRAKE